MSDKHIYIEKNLETLNLCASCNCAWKEIRRSSLRRGSHTEHGEHVNACVKDMQRQINKSVWKSTFQHEQNFVNIFMCISRAYMTFFTKSCFLGSLLSYFSDFRFWRLLHSVLTCEFEAVMLFIRSRQLKSTEYLLRLLILHFFVTADFSKDGS